MARLIDADKLKSHYAWWGELKETREYSLPQMKELFDSIIDEQETVEIAEGGGGNATD